MFKLVAKVLIFIASFVLLVLGVVSFIYYFAYYLPKFDAPQIACIICQGIIMTAGGVYGIISIRKALPTWPLFIVAGLVLGLAVYYLYRVYGTTDTTAVIYYHVLGYVNAFIAVATGLACYWNRK